MSGIVRAAAVLVLLAGLARAQAKPQKPPKKAPEKKPEKAVKIDLAAARAELADPDTGTAVGAAVKLGETKQAGALDVLLDGLAMGLEPDVAQAALESLEVQADGKSLSILLYYAHHRTAGVRAQAVTSLGRLDEKKGKAVILAALRDPEEEVRAAAAGVIARTKDKKSADELLALLVKGDAAVVPALAAIGDADLARKVAELTREAPDALVAQTLGQMLLRTDLGPEAVYVDVVRALSKVPGDDAVAALVQFVAAQPPTTVRLSKREAELTIELRSGGQ